MAQDRKRIRPEPTARELLWNCRGLLAKVLLSSSRIPGDDDGDLAEVNDLVADCQADIRDRGDTRPDWLDDLERLADRLEARYAVDQEWIAFLADHPELDASA